MVQYIILSGCFHLIEQIQNYFGKVNKIEYRYFPDNELYIRFPFEVEKEVILFQSMYGEPDKKLVETLFASYTLQDLGAKEIFAVIPYLAYTRQDRRFKEGEAISQLITLKLLRDSGVKYILTFDGHFHSGMPKIEGLYIQNIKLAPYFKGVFKDLHGNFVIIGPDDDALELAKLLSNELGFEYGYIEKKRMGDTNVEMKKCSIEVKNKNVIIIDDMISTGSTIIEAIKLLKNEGAKDIYVAATHGLFVSNAIEKINSMEIKKIITSNTVPNPFAQLDIIPILYKELEKWMK